jgi:hypothetical protein
MLCAGLLAVQTACHNYLPLQESVPERGEIIGVVLNDQGRALVGERLGESVDRVDGVMVEQTESAITLNVTKTRSLRGSHAVWSGEAVTIPKVGIRGYQERQYSRGKTAMLVVGLILGIAAVGSLITLAAGGFGRGDDPGPGPDPQ